jgi:hypothetical protein
MANSYGPKSIVTEGLVFSADAGNAQCYTSGSATATDLINGEPLTLTGTSPTYDSNYGGVWSFAGGAYYITLDNDPILFNSGLPFTAVCWHYLDDYSPDAYPGWMRIKTNESTGFWCGMTNDGSYSTPFFGSDSNFARGRASAISTSAPLATWNQTCVTYNGSAPGTLGNYKLYWNGVEQTVTAPGGFQPTPNTTRIGQGNTTSTEWDGFIGPVMLYNKELTPSEILQNYNSQKTRFGL